MKPLKELNPIEEGDPLEELADILLSFIDDGLIKNLAMNSFYGNKPRVKAIIKNNKYKLISLIKRV